MRRTGSPGLPIIVIGTTVGVEAGVRIGSIIIVKAIEKHTEIKSLRMNYFLNIVF